MPTESTRSGIAVPGAPAIPGLRFRLYRGREDLPAMAEVGRAAAAADGDRDPFSIERMAVDYANLTNSDPFEDFLLAEVDERLVAWSRVEWKDDTDGSRGYLSVGRVHPAWRRRGIGRSMLRYGEQRLRAIAAGHEFDARRWLVTWSREGEAEARRLYEAEGYRQVRAYRLMVRPHLEDISIPPMPEGLEVRPVERDGVRAVFDAAVEAFRDHFGELDGSDAEFTRWTHDPSFRREMLVVAYDGQEVAGAVQAAIDHEENELHGSQRGWTDPVFVREPWRRRGLASALLGRALVVLRERGMTAAQLEVDTQNQNQAVTLYERHGFRPASTTTEWRKPMEVGSPQG
jgi:mycothiol synthase